nr:MAG TPA: hypothetical protein [Caudoviricetes sp.]
MGRDEPRRICKERNGEASGGAACPAQPPG